MSNSLSLHWYKMLPTWTVAPHNLQGESWTSDMQFVIHLWLLWWLPCNCPLPQRAPLLHGDEIEHLHLYAEDWKQVITMVFAFSKKGNFSLAAWKKNKWIIFFLTHNCGLCIGHATCGADSCLWCTCHCWLSCPSTLCASLEFFLLFPVLSAMLLVL